MSYRMVLHTKTSVPRLRTCTLRVLLLAVALWPWQTNAAVESVPAAEAPSLSATDITLLDGLLSLRIPQGWVALAQQGKLEQTRSMRLYVNETSGQSIQMIESALPAGMRPQSGDSIWIKKIAHSVSEMEAVTSKAYRLVGIRVFQVGKLAAARIDSRDQAERGEGENHKLEALRNTTLLFTANGSLQAVTVSSPARNTTAHNQLNRQIMDSLRMLP